MEGRGTASVVRVLLVDDSPLVRRILRRVLVRDPGIEVIGEAGDPYEARDRIVALRPDVVTLDLEMPRMNGLTFLHHLMRHRPTPVVVVSSVTEEGAPLALDALEAGAVEVLGKPQSGAAGLRDFGERLRLAVRAASQAVLGSPGMLAVSGPRPTSAGPGASRRHVIAIGASTGGTRAIQTVLASAPGDWPGVLIAQHMPAAFTRSFAERLDACSGLRVEEARDGQPLVPGLALVAPGDRHLTLAGEPGQYRVRVEKRARVNFHRPSVDVTFESVAQVAGGDALGALLTGMGRDGARGLLAMRRAGAATVAQDEKTSTVYGMPRAAAEVGAAERVVPLGSLAGVIDAWVARSART